MKTLKRFFVAAALCRRWAAALVVVGALGVPAGALAQLTIAVSGDSGAGTSTWTFGGESVIPSGTGNGTRFSRETGNINSEFQFDGNLIDTAPTGADRFVAPNSGTVTISVTGITATRTITHLAFGLGGALDELGVRVGADFAIFADDAWQWSGELVMPIEIDDLNTGTFTQNGLGSAITATHVAGFWNPAMPMTLTVGGAPTTPTNAAPTLAAGVTSPITITMDRDDFANAVFAGDAGAGAYDSGDVAFVYALADLFTDTDGDTLTYSVNTDNWNLMSVRDEVQAAADFIFGAELFIDQPAAGATTAGDSIVITADDGNGGSADLTITLVINAGANQRPSLTAAVTPAFTAGLAQDLQEDFDPPVVLLDDISAVFTDPEGDAITFTFSGPATAVVTPSVRTNPDGTQDIILTAIADANNDNLIEELVITPRDAGGSGGDGETLTVDVQVERVDDPALVTIHEPLAGASFARGVPVALRASWVDPEDELEQGSDANTTWTTDNPPGTELGEGTELTLANLAEGAHTLTVTVTDGAAVYA